MEDAKIIDLFWKRDEDAIRCVSEQYGRYCRSIAFHILNSEEDTAECLNDTWLHAWNAIPPARPLKLLAFLGRITRNLAINLYRAGHAAKRGGSETAESIEELGECLDASEDNVEAGINAEIFRETLNRFLASLSEKERYLFVRRYFYVDSIRELALKCGMSEGNIKVSLYRTREKLKYHLREEEQL